MWAFDCRCYCCWFRLVGRATTRDTAITRATSLCNSGIQDVTEPLAAGRVTLAISTILEFALAVNAFLTVFRQTSGARPTPIAFPLITNFVAIRCLKGRFLDSFIWLRRSSSIAALRGRRLALPVLRCCSVSVHDEIQSCWWWCCCYLGSRCRAFVDGSQGMQRQTTAFFATQVIATGPTKGFFALAIDAGSTVGT